MKSILWRVAKRLSYKKDARCLKVNVVLYSRQVPSNVHSILMAGTTFMELCNKYYLKSGIRGNGFSRPQ